MSDLTPGSPEWCRLVTASKVAAIIGVSPFMSQRSVWHLMRGEWTPPVTDAMLRGNFLEDGVVRWWFSRQPYRPGGIKDPYDGEWAVWNAQPSYRLGDWAAATPDARADFCAWDSNDDGSGVGRRFVVKRSILVEAKTSANDDEWGTPGTDEIPLHYLTQCYWAMHVSGIHETRVPVLTSRLVFAEYVVHHVPEYGHELEARCRAFYDTLQGDPPPLDDTLSTVECMRQLHPDIEPGASVEVPYDLAREFIQSGLDSAAANRTKQRCLSALYEAAGRAQYLTCNGIRVARRQAKKGSAVSIVRTCTDPALLTLESEVA